MSNAHDPVVLTPIADFRRHVVRNTFAPMYLAYVVEGQLTDIRGALESESFQLCYISGRRVVLGCLAVLSMATGGNILSIMYASWNVLYDPYKGVPAERIERALALMNHCASCETLAELNAWMIELEAFVRETRDSLGLRAALPDLRSTTGLFGSVKLGRQWLGVLGDLALPSPIPSSWTSEPDKGSER